MSATLATTVADFLQLPNPSEGHWELHHGEVVLVAPPKTGHQRMQERLRRVLDQFVAEHYPEAFVVRVEMSFQPSSEYEVWCADVGVVTSRRDEQTADDVYLQGAPELVIEVLSPSNTVEEINEKITICQRQGCQSFWVVDAKRKEVAVTEGELTRRYKAGQRIRAVLFPQHEISIDSIFNSDESARRG